MEHSWSSLQDVDIFVLMPWLKPSDDELLLKGAIIFKNTYECRIVDIVKKVLKTKKNIPKYTTIMNFGINKTILAKYGKSPYITASYIVDYLLNNNQFLRSYSYTIKSKNNEFIVTLSA